MSGGYWRSPASPCWVLVLTPGCALVPPPAARPPRPPQDAVRAPRAPTALPDTPTARWCRVGRDTASGPLTSRHPLATHRVPSGATHEGHPRLATSARCHAQKQRGGAAPSAGRHHPRWRHGDATRTQGYDGPAPRTSACFERRGAWLHTPADRATSHAPCSSCPWCGGPHASLRRTCSRWRRTVPHRVVRPRVARCPPRWSRVAWPQGSPLGFSSRALGTQRPR